MKTKKLLCLVLSLMMILSVAVVPTVAETTELDIPEGAVKMSTLVKPNVKIENIKCTLEVYYDVYKDNTAFYIEDADDLRIFSAVSNIYTWTEANDPTYFPSDFNTSFIGKTVYLAADIDMTGVEDFKPISSHADCTTAGRPRFMGTFDGQGHTIKNLKVESSEANVGLFGFVLTGVKDSIATIQNLVIDSSCSFTYTGNSSDVGVGSLIGGLRIESYTTQSGFSDLTLTNVGAVIKNVKSYANVTSTQYAGGLIGQISHSEGFFESTVVISDCIYGGTVKGTQGAAGIAFARKVGDYQPMGFDIIGCTVSGNVVSNGDAAGILVQSDNKSSARKTSIKNCVVSGTVEGEVTDAILISPFIGSQYLTVTSCDTSNATVNSVGVAGYDYKAVSKKTITTPITEIATATGVKEFYVSTPSELEFFADYVNRLGSEATLKACLYGYTIYLTANIDMASVTDFQPIGLSDTVYFSGTFDGQGYVIDNLKIKTSADAYVGLFGVVHGAVIKNVVLGQGCSFEYNGTGTAYVGSVVGRTRNIAISNDDATSIGVTNPGILYGKVLNCYSAATVKSTSNAGGIAGIADAGGSNTGLYVGTLIKDCTNVGNVTATSYAGGIIAFNNGRNFFVENCRNAGTITGTAGAGGIGGNLTSGNTDRSVAIRNCVNNGEIAGAGSLGGIVGTNGKDRLSEIVVHGCKNFGSVAQATTSNQICISGVSASSNTFGGTDTDWTSVKFVGVQTQETGDTYSVRFLATVNDLSVVTSAGFQIEITYNGTTKTVKPLYAAYAYDSVYFQVDENTKDTAYAGAYNGVYLISAVLTDVPDGADVTFNVKTIENGVTAAEGVNVTLNSGAEVA